MSAELHKIEDAARLAMADFDPLDKTAAMPRPTWLVAAFIVAAALGIALAAYALS